LNLLLAHQAGNTKKEKRQGDDDFEEIKLVPIGVSLSGAVKILLGFNIKIGCYGPRSIVPIGVFFNKR
jgi:hypothetical protein